MTRNGKSITAFIGTYTRPEPHVDGRGEGIYVYRLDPVSGHFTHLSTTSGLINPSFLIISEDKDRLYAVNEITSQGGGPHGSVSAFTIDQTTKNLTHLNTQSTQGYSPCHLAIDGSGRHLFVANYESGSLCLLPILEDGELGPAAGTVQFQGSGPHPRQEAPHAHMVTLSPDSRFVFTVDLGTDRIWAHQLDPEKGALSLADPHWTQIHPGAGPRHMVFHPNGRFAYVINELDSTVTVFAYDDQNGALQTQQTISTLPVGFTQDNLAAEILVHPFGRFLYASNRGHDTIAIYTIDQETGRLTLAGHQSTQGTVPRHFTIDPTGSLFLVANQDSDTVIIFQIDDQSGQLIDNGRKIELFSPVCLTLL